MTALSIDARAFSAPRRAPARPTYRAMVRRALARLWQCRHRRVLALEVGDSLLDQASALPFADATFEAATLTEVLGHVPPAERVALLRELARTIAGPLYIKDRVAGSLLDRWRLLVLGGGWRVHPLAEADWRALAEASGWTIAAKLRGHYRHGLAARISPNRLEIAMRWER